MTWDYKKFLREYDFSEEEFAAAGLNWEELMAIKKDYRELQNDLYLIARYIEDKMQALESVHSVRWRVKDADHLIAKIVRKQVASPERVITVKNYRKQITDLIGIRAIHLFKEDWLYIHEFITDTWNLHETPIAYIRASDSGPYIEEYEKHGFNIKEHRFGYRSIHYLIESQPSRGLHVAEIQVRTLFEEGWSEIDHIIKYPKTVSDPLLDTFLDNFNVLAGNSDKMGSFVRNLKEDLYKGTAKLEMYEKLTEKHKGMIDTLKKQVASTTGELRTKVRGVDRKISIARDSGVDVAPFERTFQDVRERVVQFESILDKQPQRATELFERSVATLERMELLLDILLQNGYHKEEGKDEKAIIASYQSCSTHVVNNLRAIAEVESKLATLVDVDDWFMSGESHEAIERTVRQICARRGLKKLLIGPHYRHVRELTAEINANKNRIKEFSKLTKRLGDPTVALVLQTQINLLREQDEQLESFVAEKTRGPSLLGWLFRIRIFS